MAMTEYLELKTTDCMHCYKCIRNCPVKAIAFSQNQATIRNEECILCGECFVACPQNAKSIRNDIAQAKQLLHDNQRVYASVAPSFVANYPGCSIEDMQLALSQLGFFACQETALGATVVKQRYDQMVDQQEQSVILSSCCHSVNMLIQKHFPDALPFLAPVSSPMQAHCAEIRRNDPEAKTVFIGPCISKKSEAEQYPDTVDCVLTFEELSEWLAAERIALLPGAERSCDGKARLFPIDGGILRSMERNNTQYTYISIAGVENCMAALRDIIAGHIEHCFIEMSACQNSCIGGPVMEHGRASVRSYRMVDRYAGDTDFAVSCPAAADLKKSFPAQPLHHHHFSESALREVLRKIGKNDIRDELNCSSCGYDTCQDKAEAVLLGKADLTMCLPYLMNKAQSFSDTIIQNMPNGIVVLNSDLEIQQINAAACALFGIEKNSDVMGRNVVCILDPDLFFQVLDSRQNVYENKRYLAEYNRFIMQSVIIDPSSDFIISIMRDITGNETQRVMKKEMTEKTIAVADLVIAKQMRTVQEIASLLGETAAETKIALTKLKETLRDE